MGIKQTKITPSIESQQIHQPNSIQGNNKILPTPIIENSKLSQINTIHVKSNNTTDVSK